MNKTLALSAATLVATLLLHLPATAGIVDPTGVQIGEPPPPPPPPKKVYLSGSRYYTDSSVGNYMRTYTASTGDAEGAHVSTLVDSASSKAKADWYDFVKKMDGWSGSAQAYQQTHSGGSTYVVDESGNILATLSTDSLFASGLPGMSYLGNPWGNGDHNKVFVGPGSLTLDGVEYDVVAFVSVSPLVVDLDGNMEPDVDRGNWLPHAERFNTNRARLFDINGDGEPDATEWIGPRDGLLVAPLEELQVVGGQQLFGTALGFVDGYQKLAQLRDRNGDGYIRGDERQGLRVWVDRNQDAKCQPTELVGVEDLGITSINTRHSNFESTCLREGKVTRTWDWWPTVMMVRPPVAR